MQVMKEAMERLMEMPKCSAGPALSNSSLPSCVTAATQGESAMSNFQVGSTFSCTGSVQNMSSSPGVAGASTNLRKICQGGLVEFSVRGG